MMGAPDEDDPEADPGHSPLQWGMERVQRPSRNLRTVAYLDEETHRAVEQAARREERTMSQIIARALRRALGLDGHREGSGSDVP